jgi:NAD(P)H dehydrogenase (quinone)
MTTTLIVLAHPDPRSFNATWAKATERASLALGHEVIWSDLCSMGFDPIEKPSHYPGLSADDPFDVLKTQERASASGILPADVADEIDKIRRANLMVFHFPLWWFSPPATLKGWCERVLANGTLHSADARFDRGLCRGKRALFCVTTGSSAAESAHNGKEGDALLLLWPLAYTLRYLGMTVLQPEVIHGVHSYHKGEKLAALRNRLTAVIDSHAATMAGADLRPALDFNADTEFDVQGRLLPDAASHWPFIRHTP